MSASSSRSASGEPCLYKSLTSVSDLVNDPDLLAEVHAAVKQTNLSVSHAESIRKFRILPVDFTEDTGELTPTMKVKRKVVAEKFADDIDAIYTKS